MDRRQFLQLFGGVTVAGLPGFQFPSRPNRVVVVGGGIIGASIAYHLAKRGTEVMLFERERPASGATGNSFAWINASFSKQPWGYYYLSRMGIEAYRHLEHELKGDLKVKWGGSLAWHDEADQAQRMREQVGRHQAWGYATHLVDEDEFRRLEPHVTPGPVLAAAHSEQEASVDPVHVVDVLMQEAQGLGVKVDYPCEVTGLDLRWSRLRGVRTTKGDVEADALVIAAGVDSPRLAAMAGLEVPLQDSPGVLAHTKPLTSLIGRVTLSPGGHLKQLFDGRIVTGATFRGTPDMEPTREEGERVLQAMERYLPELKDAELDRVTKGWRVLPKDGYPIVGFPEGTPDVYLAVMHSGVTLSPLIGRLAALEILDGVRVDLLQPYRLSRFAAAEMSGRH